MHGDSPQSIGTRITEMRELREKAGKPLMHYGIAGYAIVRNTEQAAQNERSRLTDVKQNAAGYNNYQQWLAGTQLEQRVSLEDYSVSNRGLRSGLIGTPQQVLDQISAFEKVGVNLLLLQCSPQYEEMDRFADLVIRHTKKSRTPNETSIVGS